MHRPTAADLLIVPYAAALAVACAFAWLGYMVLTVPDVRAGNGGLPSGPVGMTWFVPAAYLAAWQFLTLRSLFASVAGAAVTGALCFGTFLASFVAGAVSFGLLVLPVSAAGVFLIAVALARLQRSYGAAADRYDAAVFHLCGGGIALFGLLVAGVPNLSRPAVEPSWAGIAGVIGALLCAFAPHAVLSWLELRRSGRPWIAWWRVLLFVPAAWALPAVALQKETGNQTALLWPARAAQIMGARQAELDLFASIGVRAPGYLAGEKLSVELERRTVEATIPPGWLGTDPRHPPKPDRGRRFGLSLAPDPRADRRLPSPTRSIAVRGQPDLVTARPVEKRSEIQHPNLWREFGCAADDASFGGLLACRQVAVERGDRLHPPLVARLPDASLRHRVMLDRSHRTSSYFLIGPAVWAECEVERECRFWFPAGERSAAWITMPEADAHRWSEAAAEADAVVRAAVGIGIEARPTQRQPDGAVLPLPSH